MRLDVIGAGLLCTWPGPAGCAWARGEQPVFKSPEEVFQAAQQATAKSDWKTFISFLAPESQNHFAGMMLVLGAVSKDVVEAPPELAPTAELKRVKDQIDKIFLTHGLSDETLKKMAADNEFPSLKKAPGPEGLSKLASRVKDPAGFAGEMMVILAPVLGKHSLHKEADFLADVSLKGVVIEGGKARGQMVKSVNGKEQFSLPIMFRRISGSWHMIIGTGETVERKP